jgi:hypothetical protein
VADTIHVELKTSCLPSAGCNVSIWCRSCGAVLLHFMICHSKNAIDPAPQDVIKTTRWNNIRDAVCGIVLVMLLSPLSLATAVTSVVASAAASCCSVFGSGAMSAVVPAVAACTDCCMWLPSFAHCVEAPQWYPLFLS